MSMKQINLYTDGACSGNPGPGGWCYILEYKGTEKEGSGYLEYTTNNQMELQAVLEGLRILVNVEPCEINLYSDSQYVTRTINEWLSGWVKTNFKGKKNIEMWKEYLELSKNHKVQAIWVKAHNGHSYNERCDSIAYNLSQGLK